MGRRFKGLTPFVIHFRVKSRLNETLRRRYTVVQLLAWLGTIGLITSSLLLLSTWLAAGGSLHRYLKFPITWVAVTGGAISFVALTGSALYFRLFLRGTIVHHLEQDMARRASEMAAPEEETEADPKRPITPSNVHMNLSFTSDFDDERF